MRLTEYTATVTTTGNAGSATGSTTVNIPKHGYIEWIYLNFHASAPGATTDTTVAYAGPSGPASGNILVKSNSATDALFFPRAGAVDNAAAAITNSHVRFPVGGPLTVSVAQCDALTGAVVATIAVADE